jgi:hypothetical protein
MKSLALLSVHPGADQPRGVHYRHAVACSHDIRPQLYLAHGVTQGIVGALLIMDRGEVRDIA